MAVFAYLSVAIFVYLKVSLAISNYLGYLWLSIVISGYLRLGLSQAISGYLWLSLAILGCFYQVSSIRVQVGLEENKLWPFETFWFFFFFFFYISLTRVIEELALLKISVTKF